MEKNMNNNIDNEQLSENDKLSVGIVRKKIFTDLEKGSLIVVSVGDENHTPSKTDIVNTKQIFMTFLKGVDGIRVIVVPYYIKVDNLSIPQLREIQSKILTPYNHAENENPVLNIELN